MYHIPESPQKALMIDIGYLFPYRQTKLIAHITVQYSTVGAVVWGGVVHAK